MQQPIDQDDEEFAGAARRPAVRRGPALSLSVGAVLLVGSTCGTSVTRDCAAFSNTRASAWQTVEAIGQSRTFTDNNGNTVVLVLNSRTDSEAFTGFDRFGEEQEVGCQMTSERRYDFDDGTTALGMNFTQFESRAGQPIDEQPLSLDIRPQSPQGESLRYGFRVELTDALAVYGNEGVTQPDRPVTTRALENVEIGGVIQPLIVEQVFTEADYVVAFAPNEASAFTRMVVSEGLGLVAFDRADGARFVRADIGVAQ